MPFGCFKKEKRVKNKEKSKKGVKAEDEVQKVDAEESTVAANKEEVIVENGASAQASPRSPRERKKSKGAKEEEAPATPQTNRENLISSESSVPAGVDRGSDSRVSSPTSPKGKGKTPRTASSPVAELPLHTVTVRVETTIDSARSTPETSNKAPIASEVIHPASARVPPTHHAPESTPATPHFFSPRTQMRRMSGFSRTSLASRGRSSSISMNDWSKIQRETDAAVAGQRQRIFERKATLAADMEAKLVALKKSEAEMKRDSTELDLDALDGLDLDGDEVALAKFKEEDYDEEALEEKILEEKIVQHLEQDVQAAKLALDALHDNSSSMDLDDLDALNEAIPTLDDSQDLDGLDLMDATTAMNGGILSGDAASDSESDSVTPPPKRTSVSGSAPTSPRGHVVINLKEKPSVRKFQRSPSASSASSSHSNDNSSHDDNSGESRDESTVKSRRKKSKTKRTTSNGHSSASESRSSTPRSARDELKRQKANSNHAIDSATEETHTERQNSDNDLSTSASASQQRITTDETHQLAVDPVA